MVENGEEYKIDRYEIRKCSVCGEDVQAWTFTPKGEDYEYRLCCRGCYTQFPPSEWYILEIK